MPEYIDTASLGGRDKWPWEDWGKTIPEGKALEITDQLNGTLPKTMATRTATAYRYGLKVIRRGERIWIAKEKTSA